MKLSSTIFVLILLLGALLVVAPGTAVAAQDGDYTYTTSGSPTVATITGYTGVGGDITIPSTLGGYPVVAIGDWAFMFNTNLTSVTIPGSVTSIGGWAFFDCSLTYVSIGNGVTSIGGWAFFDSSLTSVTIPSSVTSIGVYAFVNCSSLTAIDVNSGNANYASVDGVLYDKAITELIQCPGGKSGTLTIPSSVTTIGNYALYDCPMTSVTIGSSVTDIGDYAFGDCYSLTSITFLGLVAPTDVSDFWISSWASGTPSGIRGHAYATSNFPPPGGDFHGLTMGNYISEGGYDFTVSDGKATITGYTGAGGAITIPSTLGGYPVVAINESAFFLNMNLDSVNIPGSITTIGTGAFYGSSLTSVSIGNGVTSIGYMAFSHCSSLTSVSIPSSVTTIGYRAFSGCTSLTAIDVNSGNANYASVDGVLYDKAITELIQCPGGRAGALTIPSSVTAIGDYAFYYCTSLTDVIIPGSVTSIGDYAFYNCTSLSDMTIPGSVISIGLEAFAYCDFMTQMFFQGNAPTCDANCFFNHHVGLTIYYRLDKTGFTTPTWKNVTAYGASVPGAPSNLQTTPDGSQVVLNWTAPSSNGGFLITGYNVYRGTTSGSEVLQVTLGDVLTYTDAGLTNDQTYYYKVSAVNALGESLLSNEESATPHQTVTVPSAPQNPIATAGNAQITLAWSSPSSDGGSSIINYTVYDVSSDGTVLLVTLGNVLTYTVTSLTNGQTYFYLVRAVNSVGEGPPSNEVSATPNQSATVPSTPQNLVATAGDAQVNLTWTAPSYAGPGTLTYHLFRNGSEIWNGAGHIYSDTSVTNGVAYTYNVAANNSIGWGPNSSIVQATPTAIVPVAPGVPTNFQVTAGDRSVSLSWSAPSSNGSVALSGYRIYRGMSLAAMTLLGTVALTTYTDTGLTNGQIYYYQVCAYNSAGNGAMTEIKSATPQVLEPDTFDPNIVLYLGIAVIAILAIAAAAAFVWRRRKS